MCTVSLSCSIWRRMTASLFLPLCAKNLCKEDPRTMSHALLYFSSNGIGAYLFCLVGSRVETLALP